MEYESLRGGQAYDVDRKINKILGDEILADERTDISKILASIRWLADGNVEAARVLVELAKERPEMYDLVAPNLGRGSEILSKYDTCDKNLDTLIENFKGVTQPSPESAEAPAAVSPREKEEKLGFNQIYHLRDGEEYVGDAPFVILVKDDSQISSADRFREASYPNKVIDLVVCEDPNIQKKQLGERAVVYHF